MKALTPAALRRRPRKWLYGEDITGLAPDVLGRTRPGAGVEGRRLFKGMTVGEPELGAYRERDKRAIRTASRALALSRKAQEPLWLLAGSLSGGQQQMVER